MKILIWPVLVVLPMVHCLKMAVSMVSLVEIGGPSLRSLIHSVPLDCLYLPRLLASEFPFPLVRETYHRGITENEARELVDTFIEIPEAHEIMFNVVVVVQNPNLLDELLKYSHLYTPKVFSRGQMQQLTFDQMIYLRDTLPACLRRLGHFLTHADRLLDNLISSKTIEDDLEHDNTTDEILLLLIEVLDLNYSGFNIKLPHDLELPEYLDKLTSGSVKSFLDFYSWLSTYYAVLGKLKSMFPNDLSKLEYWRAKFALLMLIVLIDGGASKYCVMLFLDKCFMEASYWLAPPSLIDMLLYEASTNGVWVSQGEGNLLWDYFNTLHNKHPSRPYYGYKGEVALKAWRNELCTLYRHDLLSPVVISGYKDFIYYYGTFTGPIYAKISVATYLPDPIKIGNKLCETHACFLKHVQRLLPPEVGDISTPQGIVTLAKRTIMEKRAIIRLFLTLLANRKYDPNSPPARTLTSIVNSQNSGRRVATLKRLILASHIQLYLRPLFPIKEPTLIDPLFKGVAGAVLVLLYILWSNLA